MSAPTRKTTLGIVETWPLFWSLVLLGFSVAASSYYLSDLAARARHEWHPWLRPSGWIGQSAGIATFIGFVFLWLYPLRKKLGPGARIGSIPRWLDVHIAVGLTLPILGAVHAGWRFTGLIGLGFWAMIVVVLSGIAGRYLYTRVPRSRAGVELTVEQIGGEQRRMLQEMASLLKLEPAEVSRFLTPSGPSDRPRSVLATLGQLIRDDFQRRRLMRNLTKRMKEQGADAAHIDPAEMKRVRSLAMRQISLTQQLRVLEQTQRVLRYWHIAHRPVAVTALVAVLAHVAVVVLFGATWFYGG